MDRNDVRRAWDEVSRTYAERRDPDGSDAELIDDLLGMCPQNPVIVDVGCGDGARTLSNLPPDSVGLDFSREALALAEDTVPAARLLQADMTALPVVTDSVDAITAYHAVFHVPRTQQPAVYHEFARVLKQGGTLLMTLPGGRFETIRRGWMGGEMFFSAPGRDRTLEQLSDAGFENVRTRTVDDPLGSDSEYVFADAGTALDLC
jgi:SAM-dependent methyltransferase